jgi:hypothetical protein
MIPETGIRLAKDSGFACGAEARGTRSPDAAQRAALVRRGALLIRGHGPAAHRQEALHRVRDNEMRGL